MNEGILRVARGRQPASFVPSESIESVFSIMGISRDVPVVVYSGPGTSLAHTIFRGGTL